MKTIYVVALAMLTSACAMAPKTKFKTKSPEVVKNIKTVAVVGFDVTQQSTGGLVFDTNIAKKAAGNWTSQGSVQKDAYAEQILTDAVRKIQSETGWRVIPVRKVVENQVYADIYTRRYNNIWGGGKFQGGGDGDLRVVVPGMLISSELVGYGMGMDRDRKAIREALEVDAVILLSVDYRLPYEGFKIGSLVGEGTGTHVPETSFDMTIFDRNDKAVGTLTNKRKEKDSAKVGEPLKGLMVRSFNTAFEEGLIEIKEVVK